MVCKGQLDQKLGGEKERAGSSQKQTCPSRILGLGVIAGWATPQPARSPPILLPTESPLHLRKAMVNVYSAISEAHSTVARSLLRLKTPSDNVNLLVQQGAWFKSTYRGLPAIYAAIAVAATYWPFLFTSSMLHLEDWLTARECLRSRHGYLHKDTLKEKA